jgi:predicted ArsR family transcriptional regulator
MDLPKRPRNALDQPTRAQLFAELTQLRRPARTDELAERLGLHRNGVRLHLDRLREEGLVVRDDVPLGRGRPRAMWSIAPDAQPGGDPPSAYGDLGRWLARVISPGKTSLRTVEAAGREIGRDLAPSATAGSAEESMHASLVSLGFAPRREFDPKGDELTYTLCNCPYRDAVSENQPVVCTLHRGITLGLLDALAPGTQLSAFVPHDPYTAGCLIELRGELVDEAVARSGAAARPPVE